MRHFRTHGPAPSILYPNLPNTRLIQQIIEAIGPEATQTHLRQAIEVEANGGMLTANGRRKLWPIGRTKRAPGQTTAPSHIKDKPTPALVPALMWEEAKQLITQAVQTVGEARTVKITLIDRPGRVVEQTNCVVGVHCH